MKKTRHSVLNNISFFVAYFGNLQTMFILFCPCRCGQALTARMRGYAITTVQIGAINQIWRIDFFRNCECF